MRFCPPKTLDPGWANSKGGGSKNIWRDAPIPFLLTLFRKRAGAHALLAFDFLVNNKLNILILIKVHLIIDLSFMFALFHNR